MGMMSVQKISPTLQQEQALSFFLTGKSLKVNALAGSGKTSTLQLMAEHHSGKGIYLAFNKTIAEEAKIRFPQRINARTSHSLAYSAIAHHGFSYHQLTAKLNANAIVECLQIRPLSLSSQHHWSARQLAFMASETIRQFNQSDQSDISPDQVPLMGACQTLTPAKQKYLQKEVANIAKDLWQRMIDPLDDQVPLGHDGYFKYWSLSAPRIHADYLLLDEAQDSNPALLKILQQQNCQVVFVGDKFQQIYQWRGAVNAMETIQTHNQVMLSQSFRFGQAIAQHASQILQLLEPSIELLGNPEVKSQIGCSVPQTILSRSNASTVANLLNSLAMGRRPYVVGGVQELRWLLRDVALLKNSLSGTHPEFFGFSSWQQVQQFTQRPEGEHLQKLCKLVETHGERSILKALEKTCEKESQADLILSTAHKSKGREWDHVMLDDDFFAPKLLGETQDPSLQNKKNRAEVLMPPITSELIVTATNGQHYTMAAEEIRLLYVACTRAKKSLQIPEWSARFFDLPQDSFSPSAFLQGLAPLKWPGSVVVEKNSLKNTDDGCNRASNTSLSEPQMTGYLPHHPITTNIARSQPVSNSKSTRIDTSELKVLDSLCYPEKSQEKAESRYEKIIQAQLYFWASHLGSFVMACISLVLFSVLFYWFNRH